MMQVRAYRESGPVLLEQDFSPEWNACDSCGGLIDTGDFDRLTLQALQRLPATVADKRNTLEVLLLSVSNGLRESGMIRIR